MRVLYIINDYDSVSETFVRREIDMLRDTGLAVDVFSLHPTRPADEGKRGDRGRVGLVVAAVAMLRSRRALRLLRETVRFSARRPGRLPGQVFALTLAAALSRERSDFDHIHAHFFGRCADIAYFLSRLSNRSYTVTGHASEVLNPVDPERLRRNAFGASRLVGESDLIVATLEGIVGDGKPATTVRSGLPSATLDVGRVRGDQPPGKPVMLLTTARLVPKKGLRTVVEAARLLGERGRDFRWNVVGEGPLRGELEGAIADAGLEGRVHLLGATANEQALTLLRESDVFVLPCIPLPSGESDGLPAALIESVALGVPVVTTAVAAIPELVRHGETGLLVPERDAVAVANAIESLCDDPELYARLAAQGRRLGLAEYVLEDQVGKVRSLFEASASA